MRVVGKGQPWPLYIRERETFPTTEEEKWPQGRSRRVQKISPTPGFDLRTVQSDRTPVPNISSVCHERPEMLWKLPKHVGRNV